jgi:replicative DNA helicase
MQNLVGQFGFRVWALDEKTMKLKAAVVSHAFATGCKPVYRLQTRLGRVIRATGNHQFRTLREWRRLDALQVGDRIALPRRIPGGDEASLPWPEAALLGHLIGDGCTLPRHVMQYTTREADLAQTVVELSRQVFGDRVRPRIQMERRWYQVYLPAAAHLTHRRRTPVAAWLDKLGVFGFRAHEKRVPEILFEQPAETVAIFLRHLWSTDGCVWPPSEHRRHPIIYYATSSELLARGVQSSLLRVGINARVHAIDQGSKGRTQFHIGVTGHHDILTFASTVGAVGAYKSSALRACQEWVGMRRANTNRDIIPNEVWREWVVPAMERKGMTTRQLQQGLGMAYMGTALYEQNVSRERLGRLASAVGGDEHLTALSSSDIYWDSILSITPDGEEEVYDLTVPGPASFVANDFIVHNSIEQDADTVMLLHRPEMYRSSSSEPVQDEGTVEVIIAKQRNGPIGEVRLTYLKQFMRFENFAIEAPFGAG